MEKEIEFCKYPNCKEVLSKDYFGRGRDYCEKHTELAEFIKDIIHDTVNISFN